CVNALRSPHHWVSYPCTLRRGLSMNYGRLWNTEAPGQVYGPATWVAPFGDMGDTLQAWTGLGGRCAPASAHRQRDEKSSRLCRRRLEGPRIFRRQHADRRRCPDELCRRNGKSIRKARALSESRRLAGADARAARVPALD